MTEPLCLNRDPLADAAASAMVAITGAKVVTTERIRMGVMTLKYLVATADEERFVFRFFRLSARRS
jgi:hypothetical protein